MLSVSEALARVLGNFQSLDSEFIPSESAVGRGTAVRIRTGAHVPAGADAVVPIEATGASRSVIDGPLPVSIRIHEPVTAGAYVRPAGEDVRAGDLVMGRGKIVRAYDVGVLASFGLTHVKVVRRPRVAVLST